MTYKEGELLSESLKADGALVEVKIPAECTVNTNQQVRARPITIPRTPRIRRRCSTSTTSRIVPASRRTERRRRNPPGPASTLFPPNRRSEGAAMLVSFYPDKDVQTELNPVHPHSTHLNTRFARASCGAPTSTPATATSCRC